MPYKSWYSGLYENASGVTDTSLSSGTTVAGSREQTQMAFAQRLGSDEAATAYLEQVKEMAKSTNYTYDEITGYSKLLLNSYGADETLGVLMKLSDATAGLNLNSSDINMFISGLSRMRTTGKATQEYLNYFLRGAVWTSTALADATGASKSSIWGYGELRGYLRPAPRPSYPGLHSTRPMADCRKSWPPHTTRWWTTWAM